MVEVEKISTQKPSSIPPLKKDLKPELLKIFKNFSKLNSQQLEIININSINLLDDIKFIDEKFKIINKLDDKHLNIIVTELNSIYNDIKMNPHINFPEDRFEMIIKDEEDFESGVITKIGYIVDKQYKTNSYSYDITNINNSILFNNFYKSLNKLEMEKTLYLK